jgi:DNA-binding MarR family transcriptional regulator
MGLPMLPKPIKPTFLLPDTLPLQSNFNTELIYTNSDHRNKSIYIDFKTITIYLMPMTSSGPIQASTLSQYQGNLPRHLIALSRYIQSSVMQQLQKAYHHQDLRMSFEPYISMIGEGCRLTELAERLGISKQSCNQSANQLEKAGYIRRVADPLDGRGKIVVLTRQGKTLIKDGYIVITAITAEIDRLIGTNKLTTLTEMLLKLAQGLSLPNFEHSNITEIEPMLLGTLLPRCSDYVMQRLMHLTIAKGHPGLKMSHGVP